MIEWTAKKDRAFGLDGLAGRQKLEAAEIWNRADMLCAVHTLQEIEAGLIDQAMCQEGVALGKDRLAHQRGPLADDQKTYAVLPALQCNLPDPTDDPLRFAVKTRAERLRNDGVGFFEDNENLARLPVGPGPGHDR